MAGCLGNSWGGSPPWKVIARFEPLRIQRTMQITMSNGKSLVTGAVEGFETVVSVG
jgi:hypothetical protein